MKHLILYTCAMVALLQLAACSGKHPASFQAEEAETDSLALVWDSVSYSDSTRFGKTAASYVKLFVQYPTDGPEQLRDSINAWIAADTRLNAILTPEDDRETVRIKNRKGLTLPADMKAYVLAQGKTKWRADSKTLREEVAAIDSFYRANPDETDEGFRPSYEYQASIRVIYEDRYFVTLLSNCYRYLGGAHGSTNVLGCTFSKDDGHIMDHKLLTGYTRKELARIVKDGLRDYFEVKTDDELKDCLLFDSPNEAENRYTFNENFPLPVAPPYLTADGIVLVYQQYEIAPYAAGMPSVIIPRK